MILEGIRDAVSKKKRIREIHPIADLLHLPDAGLQLNQHFLEEEGASAIFIADCEPI